MLEFLVYLVSSPVIMVPLVGVTAGIVALVLVSRYLNKNIKEYNLSLSKKIQKVLDNKAKLEDGKIKKAKYRKSYKALKNKLTKLMRYNKVVTIDDDYFKNFKNLNKNLGINNKTTFQDLFNEINDQKFNNEKSLVIDSQPNKESSSNVVSTNLQPEQRTLTKAKVQEQKAEENLNKTHSDFFIPQA